MTTTRRLAAILAADVAGYSAAMERDEEGTAAAVRALRREVFEPKLAEHQGREDAELRVRTLRSQLDARFAYWHEEGVPLRQLALASGVSRETVEKLAKEVLTNPVIEQYRIVWEQSS